MYRFVWMKNYNEDSNEGCFFKVEVQCPENLHELQNHLHFLPERMKTEKIERVAANLHDKKESVIHMKIYKKFKTSIKL